MAQTSKTMTQSVMATLIAASLLAISADAGQDKPLRIGIAKSFLYEQPKSLVDIATDDFKDVMKKTIGLDGETIPDFDAGQIAEKVNAKKLDFGFLHAHEFAWTQKKYPDVRPLLIAATKLPTRAYVIVHKNNTAKTIADLRGQKLDLPSGITEPCRVFLAKHSADKDQKDPAKFFGSIAKSAAPKDALDDVARGKVDATVVDTNALDFYKENRGPVFEKNLRVLQQSEEFPPSLLVYKPGAVDQKIVDQFRDGLLRAHTIPDGRDMLKTWNLEGFEPLPKDYDKRLAEILKAYPAR